MNYVSVQCLAILNDLGFVWTGPPPCCMDRLAPPLCMDRPHILVPTVFLPGGFPYLACTHCTIPTSALVFGGNIFTHPYHYIKMEATKAVWVQNYTYLIYKAEIVCVCVRDTRARFLLRRPQTRCGCWGHCGSGYSGVAVARLAVHRELSFHFCFFLRGRLPFSNYRSHRLPSFTRLDSLSSYIQI